jgi:apolipoprotein N-acyltransferase
LTRELGTALLVGIDRVHVFPGAQGKPDIRTYNSSVLVDTEGNLVGTYDKMHRVPFGEYIPFADWFPVLYRLTPLTGGIAAGESPTVLDLDGVIYSVNICYETAVPHLIRRHVAQSADGEKPDVLVNLTNDAWYWGSSELDMHLACGVFRAVEMRIPLVIAANGGLSGSIDVAGNLRHVTTRQKPTFLIVEVSLPHVPTSLYSRWGDWFAILCVLCCIVLAVVGWRGRESSRAPAGVPSLKDTDDPARC